MMMTSPGISRNEVKRLETLDRYQILDTDPEDCFDNLTRLSAYICETPMACVSLVDRDRQWFKSKVGIEIAEAPRANSFCAYAIDQPNEILIVPNTLADERFVNNSWVVSEPEIRFYAGVPLVTSEGDVIGTLCVLDRQPRTLTFHQIEVLKRLGDQVLLQIKLRLKAARLAQLELYLDQEEQLSAVGQLVSDITHEISNPITTIHDNVRRLEAYSQDLLGRVQAYQQYYPEPPTFIQPLIREIDVKFVNQDLQGLFDSSLRGTNQIRDIVFSLCHFAYIKNKEIEQVNICDEIKDTLLILQCRLKDTLVFYEGTPCPLIMGYSKYLNQVLMAILTNAIHAVDSYPKSQKKIHIWTEEIRHGNWIAIHVADNGGGISENLRSRIFNPFFTTKSRGLGLGLGLSISHKIITQFHGGKIYFHSRPDEGTEFVMELPIQFSGNSGLDNMNLNWQERRGGIQIESQ